MPIEITGLRLPAPTPLPEIDPVVTKTPTGKLIPEKSAEPAVIVDVKASALPTKAPASETVLLPAKPAGGQTLPPPRIPVADVHVVSDHVFTIFKDATGQLVTRSRSLVTGSITYEPKSYSLIKPTVSIVA